MSEPNIRQRRAPIIIRPRVERVLLPGRIDNTTVDTQRPQPDNDFPRGLVQPTPPRRHHSRMCHLHSNFLIATNKTNPVHVHLRVRTNIPPTTPARRATQNLRTLPKPLVHPPGAANNTVPLTGTALKAVIMSGTHGCG